MKPVLATVIFGLAASSLVAANAAQDCRTAADVVSSVSSLAQNEKRMGHIERHLSDQKTIPPRTQFKDWAEFAGVQAAWQKADVPEKDLAKCPDKAKESNNDKRDCADAKVVGLTNGIKCTKVGSDGTCSGHGAKVSTFDAKKVVFWYSNSRAVDGKWTLVSAYPVASDKCPDKQ